MHQHIWSRVSGGTVSPQMRLIEGGRRYTRAASLARAYIPVAAMRLPYPALSLAFMTLIIIRLHRNLNIKAFFNESAV